MPSGCSVFLFFVIVTFKGKLIEAGEGTTEENDLF